MNTNYQLNGLSDQIKNQNNKRKLSIVLTIIVVLLLILIVALLFAPRVTATDSEELANLTYQINELRKSKEKCYDDLTYQQSIQVYELKDKFCFERDEKIMLLREQADKLSSKWYEMVGLAQKVTD